MARPLSNDLRERVIARVLAGETVRRGATLFAVSLSRVVTWSQRWRATGSAAAQAMGSKRRWRPAERGAGVVVVAGSLAMVGLETS
jgi:transposase